MMNKLIFLDTETTGNDLAKDRLCQVCYKKIDKDIKCEYFKPPVPISIKSSSITHITNKMVEDKTAFADSQMKKDLEAIVPDVIVVAHNAKFDLAMLAAEGLKFPNFICTLRVAREMDSAGIIPEYGLQFLRYFLELEIEAQAHDAQGDVKVLEAIFWRQFAKMKETGLSDEEVIAKMIEISSHPSLMQKFNFGKYKGQPVAEVAKMDRGYLEWLLNQKLENGDDDEDWVYTLKYFLSLK